MIHPENQVEARYRYYWLNFDFFPFREWPEGVQRAAMKPSNQNRFTLFLHLVGNGLDPDVAVEAMSEVYPLDADARRQMAWLAKEARKDEFWQRYTFFDMRVGHVM